MAGVSEMQQQRDGEVRLRPNWVAGLPTLAVDAELIQDTRKRLHVSRAVLSGRLRFAPSPLLWAAYQKMPPGQGGHSTSNDQNSGTSISSSNRTCQETSPWSRQQ